MNMKDTMFECANDSRESNGLLPWRFHLPKRTCELCLATTATGRRQHRCRGATHMQRADTLRAMRDALATATPAEVERLVAACMRTPMPERPRPSTVPNAIDCEYCSARIATSFQHVRVGVKCYTYTLLYVLLRAFYHEPLAAADADADAAERASVVSVMRHVMTLEQQMALLATSIAEIKRDTAMLCDDRAANAYRLSEMSAWLATQRPPPAAAPSVFPTTAAPLYDDGDDDDDDESI